ncbi:MAG: cytochrome c3 family protein, partial [Coriobacteriia bacterium]
FNCSDCHSVNLYNEHGRVSSKTDAAGCGACHTVYAGYALNTYDFTCGGTGTVLVGATQPCHFASEAQHTFTEQKYIDSSHAATETAPTPELSECWSCHGKNLVTIHSNSVTSNDAKGAAYITSCLSCHGTTIFPTTADCTNVVCHTVTGVHSMATHPVPPHIATNDGQTTVPRTGGKSCSTCHALEIANPAGGEHAKTSSVTDPGGAAIVCSTCHSAPYFASIQPWIGTTTNTCIACHKVGSGLPSATTAGEPHELADYDAEHNYSNALNESSCGSTTMTCHSGSTVFLGNMRYADTLHAVTKPGAGDCTSCHKTNTAVPTQRTCTGTAGGCHVDYNHNIGPAHASTQVLFATNGDCLPCHAGYTDLSTGHGGTTCAKCHDSDILTATKTRYLKTTFTGECKGCHNDTTIGGKTYYTADPNHYNETTHTADISLDTTLTGGSVITTKACTACHATALKAEHVLTLSASGDMSVNCVECHTDTTLGSSTVIANDWPAPRKCASCHGALHNSLGASHDMSTSAISLGCSGVDCHDGSNIATLHADRVLSTNAAVTSCNVCHANADTALTATGCNSTGCHSAAGHSHPLDTTASVGCYSTGAGCHVSTDADYASTAYHPDNGCTNGLCHDLVPGGDVNPSKATHPNPNSCQGCHDSTYTNAPDTVPITDPYPSGHYNETTHTASGLATVVRGTTNGTAGAACRDCHDDSAASGPNDWYYQHQGIRTGNLTCVGCHNKSPQISALITDTTRTDTCTACHATGTGLVEAQHSSANAPVVTGSSTAGCGATGTNCHTSYDLHELHKNSAKGCGTSDGTTNMVGCHDFRTQGIKPTIKTCAQAGGCHATYTESTHYAANLAEHTSTTQGSATYTLNGASTTCGSCHGMELNPEHSLGTSALSGTGSVCLRCHNNGGSTAAITGNWSTDVCDACHDGSGISTRHLNVANHTVANSCGSTGVGCHNTTDLSRVGADKTVNIHNDCLTCHDPAGAASWTYGVAGNLKYNPLAKTCGGATGCHTDVYYSPTVHNIGQAGEVNGNDTKHTASAAAMSTKVDAYVNNNACSTCHSSTLGTAHATTSMVSDPSCTTGGTGNLGCHNSTALSNSPTQVKASWPAKECDDCHATSHDTYTLSTHTSLVGASTADANDADSCVSGGCHLAGATSDVRLMHDRATSGCSATGQDSLSGNSGANAA